MERLQEAAKALKLYPKLKLGEKLPGSGVKSTGPHTIKITAEPTTTTIMKMGKPTKVFKFLVEEKGQLYKWFVPIYNKEGEGHYLIERLQFVAVGEEIVVEMKKAGARNFIEVRPVGDPGQSDHDSEDEVEVEPSEDDQLQLEQV